MIIKVIIADKRAVAVSHEPLVCGNSDYIIDFTFDEEWDKYQTKTARFIFDDRSYTDVVFTGTQCPVPVLKNTHDVIVGVYAGNLRTTTPAYLHAQRSILCGEGAPADPDPDVYAQIMELLNKGGTGGSVTPEQIQQAVDSYLTEHPVQTEETDPTVPDWAKQPEKPSYTAKEVGAMSADAEIVDATARQGVAENAKEIDVLSEAKVDKNGVNQVTKENADFVAKLPSTNLFNESTMTTLASWFYWRGPTGAGNEVLLVTNNNTSPYAAIEIPITKSGDITIRMSGWAKIYAYFFTDENNIAITYGAGIMAELQNGYTATAPDGAKKMLLSILQYEASYDHNESNRMMVNYGATAAPWEAYGERYVFEGVEYEDGRVDAAVSIVGDKNNAVSIKLPEQYALVVGDTFELFYKGIVNAVNPDLFDVRVTCAKGNAYTKRYVWTPTAADVGSHALTVELYGINHNLLATKTIQLVVKNKATSPAAPVNVLCVGDSLTTGGSWVAEFQRRLIATGGTPAGDGLTNINFIGTRDNGTVRYEGYGGWKFESYVTENVSFNARIITCAHDKDEAVDQHSVYRDSAGVQWKIETVYDDSIFIIAVSGEGREFPESGTLTWVSGGTNHADIVYTASEKAPGNPFWDASTGKVDIAAYAERLGVSSIDYVYVLLGWNDADKSEEDYKRYAQSFIRHFRNYKSDIRVVYMGLQIPARDGLGANYGARGTYTDYHGLMQYVFNLDEWYNDLKSEHPGNLTTINIAGQFDTEHNSITATRTVNARNSETETYQSNGVHPAHSGYMQIADAAYRDLTHKLQS